MRKRRVHFHHFMRDVHREMDTLKGREDPLAEVAWRIAKRYRLICFDEFHVNDIADAMILGRLLQRTMDRGVVYCMTSNYSPDGLYPEACSANASCRPSRCSRSAWTSCSSMRRWTTASAHSSGSRSITRPSARTPTPGCGAFSTRCARWRRSIHELDVEGRVLNYRHRAGGVVWFDFEVLCGGPRSHLDYLDLAKRFHTVILSNVPRLSPKASSEARRFTWLVDVFYDAKVKLVLSAAAPPEEIYTDGVFANEFARTVSRLIEMQSREYLAEERRRVDGAPALGQRASA